MSGNKLNTGSTAIAEDGDEVPVAETATPEAASPAAAGATAAAGPAKWNNWKDLIDRFSYQGIVRNIPYLMFLTLLCILYITNNNRAISLTRDINDKTKELKELRWRYMDIQSRLMYQTSEAQLIPKAAVIGLKPLEKPAFEINIKVPAKTEE